jgi:hypothetical protein
MIVTRRQRGNFHDCLLSAGGARRRAPHNTSVRSMGAISGRLVVVVIGGVAALLFAGSFSRRIIPSAQSKSNAGPALRIHLNMGHTRARTHSRQPPPSWGRNGCAHDRTGVRRPPPVGPHDEATQCAGAPVSLAGNASQSLAAAAAATPLASACARRTTRTNRAPRGPPIGLERVTGTRPELAGHHTITRPYRATKAREHTIGGGGGK